MINNIITILLFLLISINFKNELNMVYFIPFVVLLLIYLNTSTHEHFLCKIENSVNKMMEPNRFLGKLKNKTMDNYRKYGPDALLNKFRNNTRDNLLKINKNVENIILKI
jgi:hypothetical protein